MPLLTVNNLTTSVIPIQDPSGLSQFSQKVPSSGTLGPVAVTLDQLAHLEPVLVAEATAGRITWSVSDNPASQADSPPDSLKTVLTTPYNAVAGDQDIVTNLTTPGAVSVVLAASAPIGARVTVMDGKGDAGTNNITATVAGGGTINGGANSVISSNYGTAEFVKVTATAWLKVA